MNIPHISIEEHPYGYALTRDGELMQTPKRSELVFMTLPLAEAVAEEFLSSFHKKNSPASGGTQGGGNIEPESLPPTPPVNGGANNDQAFSRQLTKLSYTALDQVEEAREIIIESMLAYLHTDTICYMSEDPELEKHERKHWQPIIDWAKERFGCEVEVFTGVMPGDQSEETAELLGAHMQSYNNWQLAALMSFTTGYSSVLIALAVMEGRLNAEQAFDCAMAEEIFQNEKWGVDEEAEMRRAQIKAELLETERFLALL